MPEMKFSDYLKQVKVVHDPTAVKSIPQPSACAPDCKICNGLGWVMYDYPIDDPRFGKIQPCKNANIFAIYGAKVGIDESEVSLSWNSILNQGVRKQAVKVIRSVCEKGAGWVYLWGDAGTGKTHMLKTSIAEWIKGTRKPAAYARMSDIIDYLRASYGKENGSEIAISRMDYYATVPFLAIDEVDKMRGTEYASEQRFTLFDKRHELAAREQGVTLFASNTDPREFLDDYLLSRVCDGRSTIIQMTGPDVRPTMKY